ARHVGVAGDADDFDGAVGGEDVRQQAAHQRRVVHDQHTNRALGARVGNGLGVHGVSPARLQSNSSTSPPPAALLPMLSRYSFSWWLMTRFSTCRRRRIFTRPLVGK